MEVTLNTVEEAINFLESYDPKNEVKVHFVNELKTLSIKIEGPLYKGVLTGELARGLTEFQDEIYRAARFTLLNDVGRLNASQKEAFELSIEVLEGSSLINIDLGKLGEGLSSTLQNMTPGELTILSVSVALVLAAGWVGKNWLAEHYKAKLALANNQEETNRLTVVTTAMEKIANNDARVCRFAEASANGVREIAARATGATSVKIGRAELDEDALASLRRRAPRTTSEAIHETGNFRIFYLDATSESFIMGIGGTVIDGEFDVEFDKSDFNDAQIEALSTALINRSDIKLEVKAIKVREKIRGGVLIDIEVPVKAEDAVQDIN